MELIQQQHPTKKGILDSFIVSDNNRMLYVLCIIQIYSGITHDKSAQWGAFIHIDSRS